MATESYHPSIYTPDLQENRLSGQEAPAGLVTPELALSAKLILDTATTHNTSEFQERFKADPSLPGLHPLAKAFAYMELDNASMLLTEELINSALQTCWLFYVLEFEKGYDGPAFIAEIENVTHAIGPCEFESTGTMKWPIYEYYGTVSAVSFKEAEKSNLVNTDIIQPAALFNLWKQHNRLTPNCYLNDGMAYVFGRDFIGDIEFHLVRIGPFPVGRQTITVSDFDGNSVDDDGTEFGRLVMGEDLDFDEDEDDYLELDDKICWLNLLSQEQARTIGIPENNHPSSRDADDSGPYPVWVDRKWAKKNGWFSIEDLEDSYSQGSISPKRISFLIAQDENWVPQDLSFPGEEEEDEEEDEDEDEELEAIYPPPALFAWKIKVDDVSVDDTLAKVLSKIKVLVAKSDNDGATVPPIPAS